MLDIHLIREQPDRIRAELQKRNMTFDFDAFLTLDAARRGQIQTLDDLRAQHNAAAETFPTLNAEQKERHKEEMKAMKARIADLEETVNGMSDQWTSLLLQLPNMSDESVPVGPNESANVVIKTVGSKPVFDFAPLPHYEIPSIKRFIDAERGAKVSGSRFWYLKGALAQLEVALMHYAFDFYIQKGFVPMLVPMLVREEAMFGTGFFPADENEIYSVNKEDDNLYLVGTAEVSLAAYHMNEVVDLSSGPVRYVGSSSCFRREAGTYGKDLRGIIRGHQFNKVEMFVYCRPEESIDQHEYLLACAEEFLQSLGLHYQVLNMCTGDIGAPNAKKYDIETWMSGQNAYRETNSCSNDTDFQSRRLNCKYIASGGKKEFVHTLNNTGCADLRTLIALCENYQQKDGSVLIPEVLRSYCGFDVIHE